MTCRISGRPGFSILLFTLAGLACVLIATTSAQQSTDIDTTSKEAKRFAELEKSLTGVTLVGHSTETGAEVTKLEAERYDLLSVKHVGDDQWLFTARIQYGDHDVTLPLTLPVLWAGDTPVITVNKMLIPGLGTYSARVMIYADHYAGFWSGSDHGGHLFGVVEKQKPIEEK